MDLNREELRSVIIAMVMGDGCLSCRKGRSEAFFQMSHCEAQYEYMLWKKKFLDKITSSSIHKTKRELNGKIFYGYHLGTRQHPMLTKLRKRMYYNGRKVLDEYIVKKLNPLSLAILFMDNGTHGFNPNGKDVTFYLSTEAYDYANQLLLKKSLKLKFDLDWNINKAGKTKLGNYKYRLRLRNKHNDRFVEIIKPYIVPCMRYKLGPYANLLDDKSSSDIVRPTQQCVETGRNDQSCQ